MNETSRRIVEVLAERGASPLPSRLTQHSHHQTEEKMRRQERLAEAVHEECTFQPQINHTTEKMIEVMDTCGRNQDFLQRQQDYIDLQVTPPWTVRANLKHQILWQLFQAIGTITR